MKPDGLLMHDARYFVPVIGWYARLRRAEICALALDGIEVINSLWLFNIRPTEMRRLKTITSARKVPFAEALIRLSLPRYVISLRDVGKTLLFPELASESGLGSMGDRF